MLRSALSPGPVTDALQKAMTQDCNFNCPALTTQSIAQGNKCTVTRKVEEDVDGWLTELPGGWVQVS